jgi:sn-1 stearoyl-lipid 9-desaturase
LAARAVDRFKDINWLTNIILLVFHIAAIAALFFFSWQGLILALLLWWITGSLGIGMGYHRLLTHRSYKAPKWLEYLFTIFATMTLQGGPIFWVGTHRLHHRHADMPGDPHSPRDGKWWSHMGWITSGKSMHRSTEERAAYVRDLTNDPFHVWISRWHWVPLTASGLLILVTFGWQVTLWSVFLRVVLGLHFTWLVNSATHLWGSRRFETNDDSRNSFWVAILTFGEGWHNNHHFSMGSCRQGIRWWEIDITYGVLKLLVLFGIARDLHPFRISAPRAQEAE